MRRGPGFAVEVLPLTMVNMLQRLDSEKVMRDDANVLKHTPGKLNIMVRQLSLYEQGTNERMDTQESNSDSESNEDCNEGIQLVGPVDDEFEFGNTKLEILVLLEVPQQILQVTL